MVLFCFKGKQDTRQQERREKRIIITYGASSQLGWSLFSKLPLIFINTPDKPIDKSFKTKFKKSIFLFDYDNKNFFKSELIFNL